MTKQLITNNRLRNFLIDRGVYEKFICNLIKSLKNKTSMEASIKLQNVNYDEKYPILAAFTWCNTPEGDSFWEYLQNDYDLSFDGSINDSGRFGYDIPVKEEDTETEHRTEEQPEPERVANHWTGMNAGTMFHGYTEQDINDFLGDLGNYIHNPQYEWGNITTTNANIGNFW